MVGPDPARLGLFTALYGVVFAAAQTDMKRLLAYSSIENIGILFTGFGLALVFRAAGMGVVATLALVAVLYHALNHAFMKSLLFLGTGAVLHATGERNLGRLGGLIHRMPWVAWLTLVGALAIAGLPPLNGFVSEWLLLQAFLFAHEVPHTFVNMLLPMGAALLVLAAALAGYVMVKFFGVIFLGQPREPSLQQAHDAGLLERRAAWLAAGCVLLGLLPVQVIPALATVGRQLGFAALPPHRARGCCCRCPIARPPTRRVLLLAIAAVVALTYLAVRISTTSACGAARPGTAASRARRPHAGHGRRLRPAHPPHLRPFFALQRELPTPFDRVPRYRVLIGDRFWRALYQPLGALVQWLADRSRACSRGGSRSTWPTAS